jgi:hypothetical protein
VEDAKHANQIFFTTFFSVNLREEEDKDLPPLKTGV